MVEILLSTYNGEKYLSQQLDSLLNQSYPHIKIVVRDDGSSDSTLSIINSYAAQYPNVISVVEGEGNVGFVRSFELLLEQSEADYIMFCDQDDVWFSTKVEQTMRFFKQFEELHPAVPLCVATDMEVVDENGQQLGRRYFRQNRVYIPNSFSFNRIIYNCPCAGCSMMINKAAKELVLPFPDVVSFHDWWIAAKVAKSGFVIPLDKPTMYYRQHRDNQAGTKELPKHYYLNLLKKPFSFFRRIHSLMPFLRAAGYRGSFLGYLIGKTLWVRRK